MKKSTIPLAGPCPRVCARSVGLPWALACRQQLFGQRLVAFSYLLIAFRYLLVGALRDLLVPFGDLLIALGYLLIALGYLLVPFRQLLVANLTGRRRRELRVALRNLLIAFGDLLVSTLRDLLVPFGNLLVALRQRLIAFGQLVVATFRITAGTGILTNSFHSGRFFGSVAVHVLLPQRFLLHREFAGIGCLRGSITFRDLFIGRRRLGTFQHLALDLHGRTR
ncbi:MAG TPA: hypothetical protein VEW69_03085 [Alphaproteobacteria bacterium]|nr:hypothetical protein [Alphaproteobacteria bacterium]